MQVLQVHSTCCLTGDDESLRIFQRISGFRDPTNIEYNYGTSITQLMFTPQDPGAPESPPGESPYAGWLGLGFSLHAKDSYAINSVELSIGTVRPNSQAREVQDFIHKLKGVDRFKGWGSQIPNEPTLNLFYSQKRRMTFLESEWGKFAVDGFSEWGPGSATSELISTWGLSHALAGICQWTFPIPDCPQQLIHINPSRQIAEKLANGHSYV